ncbi:general substrate transporter [Peniophora sp. CONT]|nr:general substrate transporter [Peniophora sp. CONT]
MPQTFTLTKYGWLVCTWVLIASFQYGYHISVLNQIQAVLTCRVVDTEGYAYGLPTCIPMSDAGFSVVTSVYTLGGLLGSLGANRLQDKLGRKGALRISGFFLAVGSGFMTIAAQYFVLVLGRLLTGIGAGIGLCVGPIFLSEIAPPKIRGSVGVLTQFGIVIGLMVTQAIGLRLADPKRWRAVLLISSVLSIVQILLSPAIAETPEWLKQNKMGDLATKAERRLWKFNKTVTAGTEDAEDPLLGDGLMEESEADRRLEREETVSMLQVFTVSKFRRPLVIVCSAMISQQVSGINAVLYYSNDILGRALPDLGPYVSLGITVVNVIMTFAPIILIERMGRKQLLFISIGGILASLFLVGIGLNTSTVALSSVAIMTFVMSFAIGLGPVPFVMIPEVSPPEAVSALSSTALSLNWVANFFVGLAFLPLRNLLSGGNSDKEGLVFFVFAAILTVSAAVLHRAYRV